LFLEKKNHRLVFVSRKGNYSKDPFETLQSEMKMYGGIETLALKQHFGKKIMELEEEKRAVQVSF
jgi:hypothetical protein